MVDCDHVVDRALHVPEIVESARSTQPTPIVPWRTLPTLADSLVAPESSEQVVPDGWPMPKPMVMVAWGEQAGERGRQRALPRSTVKGWKAVPPAWIVPLKVSVT